MEIRTNVKEKKFLGYNQFLENVGTLWNSFRNFRYEQVPTNNSGALRIGSFTVLIKKKMSNFKQKQINMKARSF